MRLCYCKVSELPNGVNRALRVNWLRRDLQRIGVALLYILKQQRNKANSLNKPLRYIMKKKKTFTPFKEFFMELFAHILVLLIFITLCAIGLAVIDFLPEKVADILIETTPIIGFFIILIFLWLVSKVIHLIHKIKKQDLRDDSTTSQEDKP